MKLSIYENQMILFSFVTQLKKMSCDLLENAKQTYKTTNGAIIEPTSTNEVAAAPKPLENTTLEQVFYSYTNVSSLLLSQLPINRMINEIIEIFFRRQSNEKNLR